MTTEQWETELQQSLKEARAEVARLRRANRGGIAPGAKEAIAEAHARCDHLLLELNIVRTTGQRYGVLIEEDLLQGILAVDIEAGTSQRHRHDMVIEAVSEALSAKAAELGIAMTASPDRFARPPRREASDASQPKSPGSRLIVEVTARIEGDYLVPISRRTKKRARR